MGDSRDNLLPPNPRNNAAAILHAGAAGKSALPPRPHRPPKFGGWIGAIIAVASWPVILFSHDLIIVLAAMIGFIASFSALIAAVSSVRQSFVLRRACLPSALSRNLRFLAIVVALFTLNSWACVETNNRWRDIDRTIGNWSQLAGIAQAVEQYRQNYNSAPTSLDDLVRTELVSERCSLLPTDPYGWKYFGTDQFVPSVKFLAQAATKDANPNSILAYEREPWSIANMRMFPRYVHSVVRVNGRVEKLTSAELVAALQDSSSAQPPH